MSSRDLLYYSVMNLPPLAAGQPPVREPVAEGTFHELFRFSGADENFSSYGLRVGRLCRRFLEGHTPLQDEITPQAVPLGEMSTPDMEVVQEKRYRRERALDTDLLAMQLGLTTTLQHTPQGLLNLDFKGVDMRLFGQSQMSLATVADGPQISAMSVIMWVEGETLGSLYQHEGTAMWKKLAALPDDAFTDLMLQLKLMRECGHTLDAMHPNNIMINMHPDESKGEHYFTIVDVGFFSPRAAEMFNRPETIARLFFPCAEKHEEHSEDIGQLLTKLVNGAKNARMGTASTEEQVARDLEVLLEVMSYDRPIIIRSAISPEQARDAARVLTSIETPVISPVAPELSSAHLHLNAFDLRQPEPKLLRHLQDIANAKLGRNQDR